MSLGVKKTKDNGKPPSSFSDFLEMKDCYYGEHLGNESTPDFKKMSTDYVESIQWILMYYYRGIPSWTYFYPHSFAPFVSDLTAVQGTSFSVSMEEPDDPYTHLLAILPKANHQLLPYSYRPFVVDEIDDLVNWNLHRLGIKKKTRYFRHLSFELTFKTDFMQFFTKLFRKLFWTTLNELIVSWMQSTRN